MLQTAPLLWLYLFFFFLSKLALFLMHNFLIKPFETISPSTSWTPDTQKLWKL